MILGSDASADQIATLRQRMGLDQPLRVQYGDFLLRALRLDFGNSLRLDAPAMAEVGQRLPVTGSAGADRARDRAAAQLPARHPGRGPAPHRDRGVVSIVSLLGQATPRFWLGIMLDPGLRALAAGAAERRIRDRAHLVLPALHARAAAGRRR